MMEKKYRVHLEAYIDLVNVKQLINWADQGWKAKKNCDYHSLMMFVTNTIEVETDCIELYVDAINQLGGDITVKWYEEV